MRRILLSAAILAFTTTSTFAASIDGSTLTATVASNLTEAQCATLVGPKNISVAAIPALPNVCVNNMGIQFSNDQLAALITEQVSSLSFEWLRLAGQAKQVVLLPAASSMAVFRILSLNMLTSDQVMMVTPDQLKGLTAKQLGLISGSYLKVMTETQMTALRSDQISAAFDKWTDQQMKNLTPDQIRGLPASQASGLVSYFTSWTQEQIHALTPDQLASIPQVFSYPWFKDVLKVLSTSQIDSLTDPAVLELAKSKDEVQTLPDALIASLTDETVVQLAKAKNLKNLSNAQLSKLQVSAIRRLKTLNLLEGLSAEQVAELPSTDLTLTAKFDGTCEKAGMTLNNLFAFYATQATEPGRLSENYKFVRVNSSGQFTVPYNATYVYFNRDVMPSNINFYGVNGTVSTVSNGKSYTVTCRTTSEQK